MWLLLTMGSSLLAQTAPSCRDVGGVISTNFLDSNTTLGSATGDLNGGLGVTVLSVTQGPGGTLIFHNHHHWVTTYGDTISLADAQATAFSTTISGLYAVSYTKGVNITGGTGRFANATGSLAIYGAVNEIEGQVVLRYQGQVCVPAGS
jgi:hypothetical protein